jgi:hypothetical protein
MFIPTAPTTTTLPFFLAISPATSMGPLSLVLAVMITASTPWPSEKVAAASARSEDGATKSAPDSRASCNLD